ncbi:hypothetical protein E2986_10811 [Frieseomelitta varia]|uniref:Uncharacterized protein n=1 Tax=Frieseomelitta varia TaxID=561572 RepID=A0A833RZG6_9HYME|nr:hypothetical protein E2986_10811 [Frieseomelitta varia]
MHRVPLIIINSETSLTSDASFLNLLILKRTELRLSRHPKCTFRKVRIDVPLETSVQNNYDPFIMVDLVAETIFQYPHARIFDDVVETRLQKTNSVVRKWGSTLHKLRAFMNVHLGKGSVWRLKIETINQAEYAKIYFILLALTTGKVLQGESQYLRGNRSLPESTSFLEPDTISPSECIRL